ncbi:hypothetical protein [Brevundimonas sp.]|uniref:hypothetical protein n=1 Tax=Brevundimonas sp. TaxID=1871086 RepID=UPI00289F280C|nr:hypothetical protein [Brevundimonas sp.]
MAEVFEVTVGDDDGASRTIRINASSEAEARQAAEPLLQGDETVIFVEAAELDELTSNGLRDHPQEGPDLNLAPAPRAADLE